MQIESHCALKGAQLLHSLELLTNEDTLLTVVRRLLSQQRYRNFRLEHFTELLRPLVVDNIDLGQVSGKHLKFKLNLAQVFDFWFRSGGIQNLLVEKREDRLRLLQLNEGREAQTNAAHWGKMPLWPLPMAVRNVSLPVRFMLSQGTLSLWFSLDFPIPQYWSWPRWTESCYPWPTSGLSICTVSTTMRPVGSGLCASWTPQRCQH